MYTAFELENFMSHESTIIPLVQGINVITGSSDSGKSTVIKGFRFLFKNRPRGNKMVSYWNRKKNGEPKEQTMFGVWLQDGHKIRRIKSPGFNGYVLCDSTDAEIERFDAVDSNVPEKILTRLNISDLNIQNQFDQHFLLSATPGEVSRFFNELIHTELIDKMLSVADSRKRETTQEIKNLEKQLKQKNDAIALYTEWLPDAKKLLQKAEKIDERMKQHREKINAVQAILVRIIAEEKIIVGAAYVVEAEKLIQKIEKIEQEKQQKKQRYTAIKALVAEYEKEVSVITRLNYIPEADKIIATLDKITKKIDNNKQKISQITDIIAEINTHTTAINKARNIEKPLQLIEKIQKEGEKIQEKQKKIDTLTEIITGYAEQEKRYSTSRKRVKELAAQMPDTCPLCNSPIKKEVV